MQPRILILTLSALAVSLTPVSAQVNDYSAIRFPELQEFEIPSPETYELANGLKVYLLEDHELPLVQVVARVRTGALWEPDDKIGLAALFGSVQRTGGTRDMTGDEIDDFLEARAASVETNVGGTVGFASMDCLTADFDAVFPLFRDVLRYPKFDEDKLEIAKAQARTGIARRNDNVLGITSREFSRLVYGQDSPMSRLQEYGTVAAVEREDLLKWHARHYHPNNVLLGVVGDFDSRSIRKKIEETLGDWQPGPAFAEPEPTYRTEQIAGRYFIEKGDVTQANIRMGHLGVTYDNPDFFPLQVMNEVLSGGFSGRLMRNIRSKKGLAYSASGRVGAGFAYPGVAGFGLQTKSETMGEAVDALYEEIEGMISNPATEAELGRAKDTILNSFIFNYASKRQILGQQMLYAYYGMPVDFLETYRANIEKVVTEDVARVAKEYLHPDKASLLVVGKAEDFDRPVSSFGEVTELDISIPPPPDTTAAVEVSEEGRAAGRQIFEEMVTVLGGDRLDEAKALRTKTRIDVSMQGQSLTLSQTMLLVFPEKMYTKIETPMGVQEVVINNGEGFMRAGGQVQPIPQDRVEEQLKDLGRDLYFLIRYPDSDSLEIALVDEEDVEGKSARVLLVSTPSIVTRLWIGPEGRVLKQTFQGTHPMTGAPGDFEIAYSDYREVDGRQLPHRRTTVIDGQPFAEATVEEIEFDPPVDETLFERPAA